MRPNQLFAHYLMRNLFVGCVLAAAVAVAGCFSDRTTVTGTDSSACSVQLPPAAFGSAVVVMRNFAFSPAQVHVRPGTKVTWVNCEAKGGENHTSTADGGKWKSPVMAAGATFTTDFTAAGSFSYHCEIHPGMTGQVVVE